MELCLWSLQTTITLAEGAVLIFLQSEVEKLLAWPSIEPTTLDLDAYDQSAICQPFTINLPSVWLAPAEDILAA